MTRKSTDIHKDLTQAMRMPFGIARNAAIESVVAEAEAHGDAALVNHALTELTTSYLYSTETPKLLVPLAKLVRNWDAAPQHFDDWSKHSMFWSFKWATWEMIRHVDVPLSGIEGWLADMAGRYREQGYSLQSVHKGEHLLAAHLGDTERAQRAFDAWMATPRDSMSDCLACDTANFGEWLAGRDDAAAVETWQPLLAGDQQCQEEPKCTLANSLLPLVRLGSTSQARDNHLRGYRMVREDDVLPSGLAQHIEFCALTGNETRALEILTDKGHYLDAEIESAYRLELWETTLLLMRRLIELGHGDDPVPGPDSRQWTPIELADWIQPRLSDLVRRFDARNGNTAVSERSAKRLAQQPFDPIPLGLAPSTSPARPRPVSGDLDTLIDRAQEFDDPTHPDAVTAWLTVAGAAEAQGVELSTLHLARTLEARARDAYRRKTSESGRECADAWNGAAALYRQMGDESTAALCRARAGRQLAALGDDEAVNEGNDLIAGATGDLERLYADGLAEERQLFAAWLMPLWVALSRGTFEPGTAEHIGRLREWADRNAEAPGMSPLRAQLLMMSGRVAERDGDLETAQQRIGEAIELWIAEGHAWRTAGPASQRVELLMAMNRMEAAEAAATEALTTEGMGIDPTGTGMLNLKLAQCRLSRNEPHGALEPALRAAGQLDQAGQNHPANFARYLAGMAFYYTGRLAQATDILTNAVSVLATTSPGHGRNARRTLGYALSELQDFRNAAEQFLLAASEARAAGEVAEQAECATAAGDVLDRLGETDRARQALTQAVELYRQAGDPVSAAVPARGLIWLDAPGEEIDLATLDRLTGACRDLADDLEATVESAQPERVAVEAALSRLQAGRLVVRFQNRVDDLGDRADHLTKTALDDLRAAREVFADLGPIGALATADHQAALLLVLSHRPDDAAAGLEAALSTDYIGDDETTAAAREELSELLDDLRSRP